MRDDVARLASLGGDGRIRLEREGGFGELVIDHPQARNALSGLMIAELAAAVEALEAWDAGQALVVRGEGEAAFCAGADLKLVRAQLDDPQVGATMNALMVELTTRLAALPMVVVAGLEGAAIGGGAELATVADLRVASRGARLRFVHATLGLSPGWGGAGRLARIVGHGRALRLLAGSEPLTAAQAMEWGLVDALATPGGAAARAREMVAPVLANPAVATRAAARSLKAWRAGDGQAAEREAFLALWGGPVMREKLR